MSNDRHDYSIMKNQENSDESTSHLIIKIGPDWGCAQREIQGRKYSLISRSGLLLVLRFVCLVVACFVMMKMENEALEDGDGWQRARFFSFKKMWFSSSPSFTSSVSIFFSSSVMLLIFFENSSFPNSVSILLEMFLLRVGWSIVWC